MPWRRERLPTPVLWTGEVHGLYSPWGQEGSDRLNNFHFSDALINSPSPRLLPVDQALSPGTRSSASGLPQPLTNPVLPPSSKAAVAFSIPYRATGHSKVFFFFKYSSLSFLLLNFKYLCLPTTSMTYEPSILKGLSSRASPRSV